MVRFAVVSCLLASRHCLHAPSISCIIVSFAKMIRFRSQGCYASAVLS